MTAIGSAPAGANPRTPGLTFVGGLIGAAILFGLIAGTLSVSGKGAVVVGLVVVFVPVVLAKRPYLTPALLLGCALTIEQFPDIHGPAGTTFTAKIPLFHGLGGLRMSPADLLLGAIALFALHKYRGDLLRRLRAPTSAALALYVFAVGLGLVSGLQHGGDMRIMFMELRPYTYLVATYAFAMIFLQSREAIRAVMWVMVGAAGLKSLQAIVVFASVRNMTPRPEAVLGHEEALFFGVFVFLTAALWLFDVRDRMRTVATCIVPFVLIADIANSRRAAWLVLGGGLLLLAIVCAKILPNRRLMLMRAGAVLGVILAVYIPAFWNKTGGLAQPARAIRSVVAPSERDASSDLYRAQEDENLKLNVQAGGLQGRGFGVRIMYPLEIVDLSDVNPLIAYIPHNGVLYNLMRMGVLGGIGLWTLIGVGIIGASRLARANDKTYAVIGVVATSAVLTYAIEGEIDQGFFFYRIAFVIGTLLGVMEAAHRLEKRQNEQSALA